MELELKRVCLDAYEMGGELTLTQEETAETIVPDYCPDIARIIETNGKVYIHSRELREGKAEVTGTVRISVLYTPDSDGGIRTMEFALPFSVESDHRGLPNCSFLAADIEPEFLETRMLNPRKVFTHCKLLARFTGYRKAPLCFCDDVETEDALCVEKLQNPQHVVLLTHIAEKDFTFMDELNLSAGKEGVAELLSNRISGIVTETKIIGSKLVFKGIFSVSVLYRTVEGMCGAMSAELPFSQIMEIEGAAESAVASLQLQLTGIDMQIGDDPEGRQIAVTLYAHVTALVREEMEVTLLSDLYSTAYNLTYEAEHLNITGFHEVMSRRQNVRELLEVGVVADTILSLNATFGPVAVSREHGNTILRTNATVSALYLDEGGVPLVAERSFDVNCQVDIPEEFRVSAKAFCGEEMQGTLSDRGIDVRFPVDFRVEAVGRTKKVCISHAKLDTEAGKDMSGTPSLVLRCIGRQEALWDLAKKYNSTIPAILAANQLENEVDIPQEKLLLIPRKRA